MKPGMKTITLSEVQGLVLHNLQLALIAPSSRLKALREKRQKINGAIEKIEEEVRGRVKATLAGIAREHGLPGLPGDLRPELVEEVPAEDGRMRVSFFAPHSATVPAVTPAPVATPKAPAKKKAKKKTKKKARKKRR